MGHSTEDGQTHTAAAWMSCRLHGSRSLTRCARGYLRQRVFLKKRKPGSEAVFHTKRDCFRAWPGTIAVHDLLPRFQSSKDLRSPRRTITHTRRVRPSKSSHRFCFVLLVLLSNYIFSLRNWQKQINMNKAAPPSNRFVLSQWQNKTLRSGCTPVYHTFSNT